jgi:Flp pilus assembly protein TadD
MRGLFIAAVAVLFYMASCGTACAHYDGELLPDSVALVEYRMVISMNPEDTVTRNKLGMVYVRQEKLDKARNEFMEILKIAPDDFDALDSLGIVSEKEGNFKEAVDWFKKAVEARPGDEGAKSRLDAAAGKLGK